MENLKDKLKEANEELNRKNGVIETEVDEEIDGEEKEKGLVRKVKISDGREFTFDFGKLTGNSIIEIKKNYGKLRKKSATLVEELDDFYYMLVVLSFGCSCSYCLHSCHRHPCIPCCWAP